MRRLLSTACLTTVAGLSFCGCGHVRPIEGVQTAAVALDVYVDKAAERLDVLTDEAIAMCNERSDSQAEYFECMAPMNATLAKAESALTVMVKGQDSVFEILESAEDFEAALQEVR